MDRLVQVTVTSSLSEITDDPASRIQARRAINRVFQDSAGGLLTAGPVEVHSWEIMAFLNDVVLWSQLHADAVLTGIVTTIISKALEQGLARLIQSISQFREWVIGSSDIPVDPVLITPLHHLAEIAERGQVHVRLSNQGISSLIDHELFELLTRIKSDSVSQHLQYPLEGVVYGSDLDDHRIDVYFPELGRKLPCYYLAHEQSRYQQFTMDGTRVKVVGTLWMVRYQTKPWKIDLEHMSFEGTY